jgi:hypothetical protein
MGAFRQAERVSAAAELSKQPLLIGVIYLVAPEFGRERGRVLFEQQVTGCNVTPEPKVDFGFPEVWQRLYWHNPANTITTSFWCVGYKELQRRIHEPFFGKPEHNH